VARRAAAKIADYSTHDCAGLCPRRYHPSAAFRDQTEGN
jgi:hypothetical protein